eukprot:1438166-Amphidinium_carterae.1
MVSGSSEWTASSQVSQVSLKDMTECPLLAVMAVRRASIFSGAPSDFIVDCHLLVGVVTLSGLAVDRWNQRGAAGEDYWKLAAGRVECSMAKLILADCQPHDVTEEKHNFLV